MPTWANLKIFMLGALWAGAGGAVPAAAFVWDSYQRYSNPIDWPMAAHMAITGAGAAVIAYWRKHKALLQEPPTKS